MARKLRFIPPNSLVEVTCRTVQGRFLLRPSREMVDMFLGVVGRAQRCHGMKIHALAALSNHYHFLLTARDAQQLAEFMGFVNSNVAREVGRLVSWRERFWSRRYEAIVVSDEENAQIARLRYVLSHGAKEGLVRSPTEWPGVHCAKALLGEARLAGTWIDRSAACLQKRSSQANNPNAFKVSEVVHLSSLPCWQQSSPEQNRQRITEMVRDIEIAAEQRRLMTGRQPLGARAVCRQHPHQRPPAMVKRLAPAFHCATRAIWLALRNAYREFTATFRQAASRYREGFFDAEFPEGCCRPGLGWVPHRESG